ncbi:MAG: hypothetical protein HY959_00800 [Ignavibacteriae bacterium]|nr:hypothetical protein [Ignavibacteriota bacterium]
MKKIILLLLLAISSASTAQNILMLENEFLKLEILEGKFQHARGQVFRSDLSVDVYGCWMKPVFKRIKLDTANSKLILEGKVVCENQGNAKMDEDDFIFMIGSLKFDTVFTGGVKVISLTVFQTQTVLVRDENEFNVTIKISSPDEVLCFTTVKNSEEKTEGKKTYYPVDPAHFYEVGKLLNK